MNRLVNFKDDDPSEKAYDCSCPTLLQQRCIPTSSFSGIIKIVGLPFKDLIFQVAIAKASVPPSNKKSSTVWSQKDTEHQGSIQFRAICSHSLFLLLITREKPPPLSYFHLAFPTLSSLPGFMASQAPSWACYACGVFFLSLHPLPLIYFIKHTCLSLHPTVFSICIHTNIQAHMLLVNANCIKPLLVDAPVRNWWAGKKITLSSWDKTC